MSVLLSFSQVLRVYTGFLACHGGLYVVVMPRNQLNERREWRVVYLIYALNMEILFRKSCAAPRPASPTPPAHAFPKSGVAQASLMLIQIFCIQCVPPAFYEIFT
jgi:hypothetical protein